VRSFLPFINVQPYYLHSYCADIVQYMVLAVYVKRFSSATMKGCGSGLDQCSEFTALILLVGWKEGHPAGEEVCITYPKGYVTKQLDVENRDSANPNLWLLTLQCIVAATIYCRCKVDDLGGYWLHYSSSLVACSWSLTFYQAEWILMLADCTSVLIPSARWYEGALEASSIIATFSLHQRVNCISVC